jgi:hypothetical protein
MATQVVYVKLKEGQTESEALEEKRQEYLVSGKNVDDYVFIADSDSKAVEPKNESIIKKDVVQKTDPIIVPSSDKRPNEADPMNVQKLPTDTSSISAPSVGPVISEHYGVSSNTSNISYDDLKDMGKLVIRKAKNDLPLLHVYDVTGIDRDIFRKPSYGLGRLSFYDDLSYDTSIMEMAFKLYDQLLFYPIDVDTEPSAYLEELGYHKITVPGQFGGDLMDVFNKLKATERNQALQMQRFLVEGQTTRTTTSHGITAYPPLVMLHNDLRDMHFGVVHEVDPWFDVMRLFNSNKMHLLPPSPTLDRTFVKMQYYQPNGMLTHFGDASVHVRRELLGMVDTIVRSNLTLGQSSVSESAGQQHIMDVLQVSTTRFGQARSFPSTINLAAGRSYLHSLVSLSLTDRWQYGDLEFDEGMTLPHVIGGLFHKLMSPASILGKVAITRTDNYLLKHVVYPNLTLAERAAVGYSDTVAKLGTVNYLSQRHGHGPMLDAFYDFALFDPVTGAGYANSGYRNSHALDPTIAGLLDNSRTILSRVYGGVPAVAVDSPFPQFEKFLIWIDLIMGGTQFTLGPAYRDETMALKQILNQVRSRYSSIMAARYYIDDITRKCALGFAYYKDNEMEFDEPIPEVTKFRVKLPVNGPYSLVFLDDLEGLAHVEVNPDILMLGLRYQRAFSLLGLCFHYVTSKLTHIAYRKREKVDAAFEMMARLGGVGPLWTRLREIFKQTPTLYDVLSVYMPSMEQLDYQHDPLIMGLDACEGFIKAHPEEFGIVPEFYYVPQTVDVEFTAQPRDYMRKHLQLSESDVSADKIYKTFTYDTWYERVHAGKIWEDYNAAENAKQIIKFSIPIPYELSETKNMLVQDPEPWASMTGIPKLTKIVIPFMLRENFYDETTNELAGAPRPRYLTTALPYTRITLGEMEDYHSEVVAYRDGVDLDFYDFPFSRRPI